MRGILKQVYVPKVGGFKDVLNHIMSYAGAINSILIAITTYEVALKRYIIHYLPWFHVSMFVGAIVFFMLFLMLLEYKFVIPSYYAFRNRQYSDGEKLLKEEGKIDIGC